MSNTNQEAITVPKRRGLSLDAMGGFAGVSRWLRSCAPAFSSMYRGELERVPNERGEKYGGCSRTTRVQPISPAEQFFKLIPGVLLLAAVGYAGKLLEQNVGKYAKEHHWTFPNIEYVLWAILVGLVISNAVGIPQIFRQASPPYEFWLKAGIVLLGSRFLLGDVLKLGVPSLALVLIEIAFAIAFMTLLGRIFDLKPKLTTLLAVGSAVCGVSAIIATKGAIDADDEDSSFAIAAILALGALSALHVSAPRTRSAPDRSRLRRLVRPCRRQHRRSRRSRCALFRCSREACRPHKDHA